MFVLPCQDNPRMEDQGNLSACANSLAHANCTSRLDDDNELDVGLKLSSSSHKKCQNDEGLHSLATAEDTPLALQPDTFLRRKSFLP